ncbi:probable isoaspartyl peptidase/L-asparaginase GA20639 [Episyrphus balteatus]|uniref:probable isoaspartyl peptidase/L-asparaginase GA20639 n=1 Tax=Episyrphus balteatus TaxID=286459 RepID=UPI002486B571|nr:probable isoaspartyl peptidase/L-asparaginase GA20639 [Episyrphus balteatus]
MAALKSLLILSIVATSFINIGFARHHKLPIVLIHGGAGDITDDRIEGKLKGVKLAAQIGYMTLTNGGSALDAVEEAVRSMELDENFNAGYGAVLTWDGEVEADASIMNGANLNAGCVSIVKNILHPISVARSVMEKSQHTYLAGEGVMRFAKDKGFEILPNGTLVTESAKKALENYKNQTVELKENHKYFGEPGTVGAVAIDAEGNIAASTSTGGLTGIGRIGDSSILGAGTYADNAMGGISATGHGETIMRYNLASRILHLMKFRGMSAQDASKTALEAMTKHFNETAGVITMDVFGDVGIYFTSKRMAWAYQRYNEIHFGLEKGDDYMEIIDQS